MKKSWLILCGLALAAFAAFGPTLKVGFLWDDHVMIETNPWVVSLAPDHLRHAFSSDVFEGTGDPYFRPLQTLLNMIDYQLWGLNPAGYHFTNLLLHILNAWGLFLLLLKLKWDRSLAATASGLFAIHPIIVEQLLIIAGRAELMALALTFAGLLLAMRRRPWADAGAVACFAGACLSKESGLAMPFFLLLIGFYDRQHRLSWKRWIPYGIAAAAYLILRAHAVGGMARPSWFEAGLFLVRDLPAILGQYAVTILFPFDLHSHRRMVFTSADVLLGIGLTLLALAFLARAKSRPAWFWFGWFIVGLLPKMPLLATNALMLDHWAYPSGIAIFVGAAAVLVNLARRSKAGRASALLLGGLIGASWIAAAWVNIQGRNTDEKMLRWALRYPSSSIVRCNLGVACYQSGRLEEARYWLEQSLRMAPNNIMTRNVYALALARLGNEEEALRILTACIEDQPLHFQSYLNRALIRGGKAGLADLEFVLAKDPGNAKALRYKKFLTAAGRGGKGQ